MEEGRPEDAAVVHMLLLELQISVKNIMLREKMCITGEKFLGIKVFQLLRGRWCRSSLFFESVVHFIVS